MSALTPPPPGLREPLPSINEQFQEIYNAQYKLSPHIQSPSPFTQQSLLNFSMKQHKFIQQLPQNNEQITIILVREITDVLLKRYAAATAQLTGPIFIITDTYYPENKIAAYPTLNIIYFFENICYENGYFYVNTDTMPHRLVISWDRCLFFLATYTNLYKNVWILEDDVGIGGPKTLPRFFERFQKSDADLICGPPNVNENDPGEWPLWATMRDSGLKSLWAAYVPICRVSRRFMETFGTFVKSKKRLFYLEILFASLCIEYNLKIEYFRDLMPHFRFTPAITYEEASNPAIEYHLFHPVKDMALWQRIYDSTG
jgi:hypothetical protein